MGVRLQLSTQCLSGTRLGLSQVITETSSSNHREITTLHNQLERNKLQSIMPKYIHTHACKHTGGVLSGWSTVVLYYQLKLNLMPGNHAQKHLNNIYHIQYVLERKCRMCTFHLPLNPALEYCNERKERFEAPITNNHINNYKYCEGDKWFLFGSTFL